MADEIRRLIRVRTRKGARFKRDGFGKKSQLSDSWRKPRGQHNKQREQKKAKGNLPKPGFGSPIAVRGMHPSGFYEVLVYSVDDLEGLNAKTHAVRISANVGNRKRAGIQEKALSAGLKVLNARESPATGRIRPAPVQAKDEPVQKKEPKKKAKPKPRKKVKESPMVKEEKKEQPKEQPKPVAKKKVKAGPAEEKPKKAKTPKVPKAKAEDASEKKPKKSPKPIAESVKETKTRPKTAQKPAARPKKKTSTGVKDNE